MEALLQQIFLKVLNMSITASYVILAVMFARVFLKKIPKAFSYALWSVVFFRLISPFSFSSVWSLFGFIKKENMQHIPSDIGMMTQPKLDIGSNAMDDMINSALPAANPIASVNPMQLILFVASVIWLLGILAMLIYTIINYRLLRKNMLSQFERGNAEGLHGQIMMRICIELLGQRNNVTDKSLSPKDWFSQLQIRQKVALPDFRYTGNDVIQKLVYETEAQRNTAKHGEFTIFGAHFFGSYEQDNKLKIFATVYSQSYILYDKTLSEEGGSIVPVAITYVKNTDGSYSLEKYVQAQDGSSFAPSIKQYCVMPVSGKKINGLYDKILKHYGNYEDIKKLERENLIQHLKVNNQNGVKLYQKQYQKEAELIPIT